MHLWLAMHAHRRMDEQQTSLVASHVEDACKDLKEALGVAPGTQVTPRAKKSATAQRMATKKRPVRGTVKGLFGNEVGEPVTPKARKGLYIADHSMKFR
jgi:separase